VVGALLGPGRVSAQDLPLRPFVFGDGRVTIGGDASATFSCADTPGPERCGEDVGYFNYSDYAHSALRSLRLDVSAAVRATPHLSVLAELRTENGEAPTAYALYARVRPWANRAFDIRVGRIPPTFGAFARRTYTYDNMLIGYPLAYQYLTSLRSDALPANADELLAMRGRGWLSQFSLGDRYPNRGLALATAFRWDTGVQVHTRTDWGEATAAITTGSLANPRVTDDNGGKQIVGRAAFRPWPGVVIGVSGARGPFLTQAAIREAPAGGDDVQAAFGADAEYSRAHYVARFEAVRSSWRLPTIGTPLRALAMSTEGRYKFHPRIYVAGRYDHLGFNTIHGVRLAGPWEAPVGRVEIGAGYLVTRNVLLKTSVQRNTREGGRVSPLKIWATQITFWL
jgi:hypothetical protein